MPRTILCQQCGLVLNLPDRIKAGKRMKCPKCAHRFEVSQADASSASTFPGDADAATASSYELGKRPPSQDDLPLPVGGGGGDLRDLFELPLGTGTSIEKAAASTRGAAVSDAEALFQDDPALRRKKTGAEARTRTRRCMQCGGAVPMGMSVCVSCGVDQETGMRVGLEDDLAPPPPQPSTGPPIHIAVTGFLCGLASALLLIYALILSIRGEPGVTQYGWLCLALVSAFGIYGAIQFFIGKSTKYLMLALTLGVLVDLTALIALPIYQANFEDRERVVIRRDPVKPGGLASADEEDVVIKPMVERIDQGTINLGLTLIGVYVALSVYLMSPPVKRYFTRQAVLASVPLL
jgi:hypothetical protein